MLCHLLTLLSFSPRTALNEYSLSKLQSGVKPQMLTYEHYFEYIMSAKCHLVGMLLLDYLYLADGIQDDLGAALVFLDHA